MVVQFNEDPVYFSQRLGDRNTLLLPSNRERIQEIKTINVSEMKAKAL